MTDTSREWQADALIAKMKQARGYMCAPTFHRGLGALMEVVGSSSRPAGR